MMDRVDQHFEKHGVSIARPELDALLEGRPRRNYSKRTHEELLGDVNALYDKLVAVVRENGRLRKDLTDANQKLDALRFVNLQFWIASIAAVVEAGAIGFLAKELFARLH